MKKSDEEKRARLRAKADIVIDEYLAWEASHPQPDLKHIEDIALKLRKELGQEIAQMAVEEQRERTPAPGPKCAKCGKEMRYKGEKEGASGKPMEQLADDTAKSIGWVQYIYDQVSRLKAGLKICPSFYARSC